MKKTLHNHQAPTAGSVPSFQLAIRNILKSTESKTSQPRSKSTNYTFEATLKISLLSEGALYAVGGGCLYETI